MKRNIVKRGCGYSVRSNMDALMPSTLRVTHAVSREVWMPLWAKVESKIKISAFSFDKEQSTL